MRISIFLQARMGSRRFPGKMLKTLGGRTMVELISKRLRQVRNASEVILVTSEKQENDVLEAEGRRLGLPVFRGAEENTLDRFYRATRQFRPDAIVRVTGDCPWIDPELIDEGIRMFREKDVDFFGNTQAYTHPHGMQFEITTREALERVWAIQRERFADEQAFRSADMNPGSPILEDSRFRKEYMVHEPNLAHIRITLDYPEDLELLNKVYELLEAQEMKGSMEDIAQIFQAHPELLEINKMHNKYL